MMRRLDESAPRSDTVTIDLDGRPVQARRGESLAAALLVSGEKVLSRSVKYHRPRAPYCFSGACSHCLMRVGGVPNVHTCRVPVEPGLRVERQNAYPSVRHDVFASIDWIFPKGMDHHRLFAGVPIAEQVMVKIARHLAGLGLLPDSPAPEGPAAETVRTDVLVVGGGPAGLAAARELAAREAQFELLERDLIVGGRLVSGAPGPDDPDLVATLAPELSARLRTRTLALGLFEDDEGRFVAAVRRSPERGLTLLKLYAKRFLLTLGGYPTVLPFANNDVPGIFAGRAVSRLIRRDHVLVGDRVVVIGEGPEPYDLARLLRAAGAEVPVILDLGESPTEPGMEGAVCGRPLAARGRMRLRGFGYALRSGEERKLTCDAIALALPPAPAFELARQGGAEVVFSPAQNAFVVAADDDGRTRERMVWVAGEQRGAMSAAQAASSGARAAVALVEGGA